MKLKMQKDITVIVILFNTPFKKIINLKQYKNFNLIIFEQGTQEISTIYDEGSVYLDDVALYNCQNSDCQQLNFNQNINSWNVSNVNNVFIFASTAIIIQHNIFKKKIKLQFKLSKLLLS